MKPTQLAPIDGPTPDAGIKRAERPGGNNASSLLPWLLSQIRRMSPQAISLREVHAESLPVEKRHKGSDGSAND